MLTEDSFIESLNISRALAGCFDFIREINKLNNIITSEAKVAIEAIEKIDSVLGVLDMTADEIPDEIKAMAEERKKAKADKNWSTADEIREAIAAKNFVVEDTTDGGYRIKRMEKS